jgi:hydroxymethylbilane synthase
MALPVLRAATRASELARWQTDHVAWLLAPVARVEPVVVTTTGDRRPDVPLHALGGQGVFVKEVQQAVLDGRADIAVHSAKDLPASRPTEGLVIAAVPERGDPRDALVGRRLDDIPPGGRIATGSVRRRAQLAWLRPDLTFAELRGNIGTRLERAREHAAIVVAMAALERLGQAGRVAEVLAPSVVVPQVGQGALAVECRADDDTARELLATVDHVPSHRALSAERALLAAIGGGCDLPVGGWATVAGTTVELVAVLASLDGHVCLRAAASGDDPASVGAAAARKLLVDAGGAALLGDLATGGRP